jgi:hypothetical protein
VAKAIARADTMVKYAIEGATVEPPRRAEIEAVRVSLGPVTAPEKQQLLQSLVALARLAKP